ncbi:Uncharacterised protein [Campylobacter ureolyticus]|uniref:hypothetical protein n=1 Tax=Campylobacter ureolyticus TaxID=827 RepID=UPI000469B2F2|nr:hypothetical protein [Campylobacter ureolyticus]STA71112.1 Uncharacterised protein [Campylobacter ureolyticus]
MELNFTKHFNEFILLGFVKVALMIVLITIFFIFFNFFIKISTYTQKPKQLTVLSDNKGLLSCLTLKNNPKQH